MWEQVGEDKGIWTEHVNTKTGEKTLKEHVLKPVWTSCKQGECFYESSNPREASCAKCASSVSLILGVHEVRDGKIISKTP